MHVDLLYRHGEAARCRRATPGSLGTHEQAPTVSPLQRAAPLTHQQQQKPQPQDQAGPVCPSGPQGSGEGAGGAGGAGGEAAGPSPLQPLSEPFLVFDFDWLRPPPPSGRREVIKVGPDAPDWGGDGRAAGGKPQPLFR